MLSIPNSIKVSYNQEMSVMKGDIKNADYRKNKWSTNFSALHLSILYKSFILSFNNDLFFYNCLRFQIFIESSMSRLYIRL